MYCSNGNYDLERKVELMKSQDFGALDVTSAERTLNESSQRWFWEQANRVRVHESVVWCCSTS